MYLIHFFSHRIFAYFFENAHIFFSFFRLIDTNYALDYKFLE